MRVRRFIPFVLLIWAPLAIASRAAAQSLTSTASMSADLRSLAKLSVSPSSLSFADVDPDTVSDVPATGGALTLTTKARATAGSQVVLTIQASDDLRSGVSVIPAAAITWTASGAGFVPGTLSKTAPVTVGQWTGSGVRTGTQALFFRNLWTYATGTYSTNLIFTLTVP